MPKYQCPRCKSIFTEAPHFCPNCGLEFLPLKHEDKEVVEVMKPLPTTNDNAGVVFAPENEVPSLEEMKEGNNKIPGRVIAGFVLAILAFLIMLFSILPAFTFGITNLPLRGFVGLGSSFLSFILATVGTACASVRYLERGKAFKITGKVFGGLTIAFSIILVLLWVAILFVLFFGEAIGELIGNDSIYEMVTYYLEGGPFIQ